MTGPFFLCPGLRIASDVEKSLFHSNMLNSALLKRQTRSVSDLTIGENERPLFQFKTVSA